MKRLPLLAALGMLGIALLVTTTGCPKKEEKPAPPTDKPVAADKAPVKPGGKKEALAANYDAVVKGKVVYDGDPPAPKPIADIDKHQDAKVCHAGMEHEKVDPTWMVGKDKGVKNAVVWLRPPDGKYFTIKDEDKKRDETVELDQPHCAFIPHVLFLYPSYYDGKGQVKTGQKFKVVNSAPVNHNSKIVGEVGVNESLNITLAAKESKEVSLNPQRDKVLVNCDIHKWMNASIWVFDNPYAAVTKEDGSFEIKNVPADVELHVVGWHEGPSYFNGGAKGKAMTFKKGDNTLEFKIK